MCDNYLWHSIGILNCGIYETSQCLMFSIVITLLLCDNSHNVISIF